MAIRYFFREPLTLKNAKDADPQAIGEALEEIQQERGGDLTPRSVLDKASNPSHILHGHFEWDDKVAADTFRLDQARVLIRSIRTEDSDGHDLPAYFSVQSKGGRSYRSYSDVIGSQDLRDRVLEQAKKDLQAWEDRYNEFEEAVRFVTRARKALDEEKPRRRTMREDRPSA